MTKPNPKSKRKVSKKQADATAMLNQALNIMQNQLDLIESNNTENLLDPKVSDTLNQNIRTLISYKKESRASLMEDDLDKLNAEDLKELAKQATEVLLKDSSK